MGNGVADAITRTNQEASRTVEAIHRDKCRLGERNLALPKRASPRVVTKKGQLNHNHARRARRRPFCGKRRYKRMSRATERG